MHVQFRIDNTNMKLIIISILSIINFSSAKNPQFRDYREVIIFAPDKQNELLKEQLAINSRDPKGLKERDLKITMKRWSSEQASTYRRWKAKPGEFTLILVGKDGGEKYRSTKPVTLEKLYSIIDVMPMRRSEMKNR